MYQESKRKLEEESPVFNQIMTDITGGDLELEEFIWRCLGYSLTGLTSEKKMFICVGPEGSYKTLFAQTMSHLLGDCAWYAPESILRKPDVKLRGVRLLAVECSTNSKVQKEYLKALIDGGPINVGGTTFNSQAKLWLFCRNAPREILYDEELWSRVYIIRFHKPKDRKAEILKNSHKLKKGALFAPFSNYLENESNSSA